MCKYPQAPGVLALPEAAVTGSCKPTGMGPL